MQSKVAQRAIAGVEEPLVPLPPLPFGSTSAWRTRSPFCAVLQRITGGGAPDDVLGLELPKEVVAAGDKVGAPDPDRFVMLVTAAAAAANRDGVEAGV